jgi:1,4-alpha-glucan branching enzyme
VLFVPGLDAGQRYKFELRNSAGRVLPHKADPLGFHAEQYPSHASIIYDHDQYQWQDQHWQERTPVNLYESPMSIYEVHLGSWQRQYHGEKSEYFSYRELALKLVNYVLEMGFTHIELMPISEYPFDGSWGYQPIGMFAPTSRFGDPDDFKYFVDQFHQAGIGVIVDWVPAHFPADEHGLGTFDGTSLFEHIDPRKGWHPDWDSYVYDFGNPFVRQFLVANALYWCERFHIDGIRVDAVASMLYLDYSRSAGEWLPNSDGSNVNYDAISLLQWLNTEVYLQHPKALTIAEESTSFAKVSAPVHLGGLGFGFKWNMGWMNDSLAYMATPHDLRSEQHDGLTFSLVYAWDENFILPLSHDEVVHGKGSLLYKMQGDEWQQGANLRAYLGFMYGHPGKKLNFMGNEIAQGAEWNHDDSIQWHLLAFEKHQGVQELFKKLNSLYCEKTALHQLDHEPAGFAWMDINSAALSLVAFVRRDKHGQKVYCISNFTPAPVYGYRLPVEDKGQFSLILNTDHRQYWGSGFTQDKAFISQDIAWHGQAQSICFDMPPLATIFIEYSGNA